ncbi:hypothetical protein ACYSNN_06835 [Peptoniphilus genitalis]
MNSYEVIKYYDFVKTYGLIKISGFMKAYKPEEKYKVLKSREVRPACDFVKLKKS